jgi:peptidoglycan-N-acetylglucosamine deacetylase
VRRRPVVGALSILVVAVGAIQALHTSRSTAYASVAPICRVRTPERIIALTFDDGPSLEHTADVLALLERNDATATFFMVGSEAVERPELVRAVVDSGHEIGDHTWSHPHLDAIPEGAATDEISRMREVLQAFGDVRYERMPYGDARPETFADLRSSGLVPIHWSIPLDHYVDGLEL